MKRTGKLDVVFSERFHMKPDWHKPDQVHGHHELLVVEHGAMSVHPAKGRKIEASAGDVLFYPSGIRHTECADPQKPPVLLIMGFHAEGLPKGVTRVADRHERISDMLRWIHLHWTHAVPVSRVEYEALGVVLVEVLLREAGSGAASLAKATRNYIKEHIAEPLTLDMLAAHAGMSSYHFLRRYKAETGSTPMRDVRDIRAYYARRLIVRTDMPLKEIAERAGLGKGPLFYQTFRKVFNRSPAQFRKRVKRGD